MKQSRLDAIKDFFKEHRRLPSYSEMLNLFNLSSKNSIFKMVNKWVGSGFLKKDKNKITPTPKFFSLPLLGEIRAGFPILAEENKEYLTLDNYLIEKPTTSFLLKVNGDSLIEIGIFEGDLVVIERDKQALPGDVVLAQIDREWTLKILRKDREKRKNYLMAANAKYPPFYPNQDLQIFGVVRAVIRKIN